jgi:recombination protein RecA
MAHEKKKTEGVDIPDRQKALELALAQIEKQFGKGSIMKMDTKTRLDVEAIPTGALSLDVALGVGGFPRGRVIEIFGPEASGKTTVALSAIKQVQRRKGTAAFIDAEHAFDSVYAKKMGLNLDDLLISQPDTGEQALEIAETLVRSNAVDLIVIDSVAALTPRAEIEGEMGDSHIGLQARLMSQALRKLTAAISKSRTCVIFINQIRMKIGIMFGNPEVTPGGRALKFYASVRLDLRRIGSIKQADTVIGSRVRARVVKNKVAPPFRETEFEILHDQGIARTRNILDTAANLGVINKSGTWYIFQEEKLGQGREQAANHLEQEPRVMEKIEKMVREKISI